MKTNIATDLHKAVDRYRRDFRYHARKCIQIKDHATVKIVPLVFNKGQDILHNVAEKQKESIGYIRVLLLKSRRFGGSTYVEGRFYNKSSLNSNRNVFIIGHERESTNTLFQMAKLMHELNPMPPRTLRSNEKALLFDTRNGKGLKSEYRLATAENVDAGRSQGIHYFHGSEEAFWRDGKTLLGGIMQCIPDPPAESEVFRESTANGYGNSFEIDVHKTYAEGRYPYYEQDGRVYAWSHTDTDWIIVFIPWFDIERYTKAFDTEEQKAAFEAKINQPVFDEEDLKWVASEALKIKRRFKLTPEQLNWREWAIEDKCRGSEDLFCQEYPSTVEEAFLSTGSNVFGKVLCDDIEALCQAPIVIGDLVVRAGKTKVRRNPHGKLSLWEVYDPTETYFITCDTGGGIQKGLTVAQEKAADPDPTCIDVYNHRTGRQAAQWHGNIEYDLVSDITEMLGNMYGRCPACVELMNHGYTTVANLEKAGYPMYEWKPQQPGWSTNAKTKPIQVDSLYQMARDASIQIMCKETVSEMRTFIELNGKFHAPSGCHDDRVDCACMASQMLKLLPKRFREQRGLKPRFTGFKNWERYVASQRQGRKPSDRNYREYYVK